MNSQIEPDNHKRKSIRLKGYDYSQGGLYFITICTQNRRHLFGTITNGEMNINSAGKMIAHHWEHLVELFPIINLHVSVVMPNHLHGIIGIVEEEEKKTTIGDIICAFKSITTLEYSRAVKNNQWPRFDKHLWQRNYYEHIIRNNDSLEKITDYIVHNPERWEEDENNV